MHPLPGTSSSRLECPDWFMPKETNHGIFIYQMGCQLEGGLEMLWECHKIREVGVVMVLNFWFTSEYKYWGGNFFLKIMVYKLIFCNFTYLPYINNGENVSYGFSPQYCNTQHTIGGRVSPGYLPKSTPWKVEYPLLIPLFVLIPVTDPMHPHNSG